MRDSQPKTIYLKDYRPPEYLIDHTELDFALGETVTVVTARLHMRRNPEAQESGAPLVLDGQHLQLRELALDDTLLEPKDYRVEADRLVIHRVPAQFTLRCVTAIEPQNNTSLEGLYRSRGLYCTQCEAEGFRKITYYLDRPDVMSVFTVTITADRAQFPVLLSNGNLEATGNNPDGSHWTRWHDPFKKPCYLFALVAGDLQCLEDRFRTASGRDVTLRIYVEPKDLDKCDHAMRSLQKAMRWDEEVYGREYDLDIFNIVAVDDFNMGAMENKSLNIFNTSCVLANPQTTSDAGFQRVEGVVAHEYFHNWSGNRVTCRDWFQLSLKEGFTVFRDAEFSADMGSPTVKRVEDVTLLRTLQFAEDAGPMAHPVRPDSYMEISNFYTLTVYEKGAEVVRMISNLLGPELFRKGCDLYFERHDGEAVTTDDFVKAMEEVSGRDMTQFRRWYSQAGTPCLTVRGEYREAEREYHLQVRQSCPPTPGQAHKEPFHIPLAMALYGDAGALRLQLRGEQPDAESADNTERVLDITEAEQHFVFVDVPERPVPSLLRGFSAPVRLDCDYSRDDLRFLIAHDSDGFSRWDAAQQLGVAVLREMIESHRAGTAMTLDMRLVDACADLLADATLDPAMVALMLTLPSEAYLVELAEEADVQAIHAARQAARERIAEALEQVLWDTYRRLQSDAPYEPSATQIAARSLKNVCLQYLMLRPGDEALGSCLDQFHAGHNMTDVLAAFSALMNSRHGEAKERAIVDFYERWREEPLVINQWFAIQAGCHLPGTLDRVCRLMAHPAFDIKNPNKVRALIGTFCSHNLVNFHHPSGEGYRFLGSRIIELDKLNPQITSRVLTPLTKWRKFPPAAQEKMRAELQRILAQPKLSTDVYEVASKSLQG